MANTHYVRQVRQYDDGSVQSTEVREHTPEVVAVGGATVAQRVISYIVGILEALLMIRFFLALFGASTGNSFVNFIYSLTHPFVMPFEGIFGASTLGVSQFETATVVAMIIYALIGWGLNAALDLGRSNAEVEM